MKSLVTGASGFIGSHLVNALLARGDDVRGLVRQRSDVSGLQGKPVEMVLGEMRDEESLRRAVEGCEVVYHAAATLGFAGRNRRRFVDVNALGTERLLRASAEAGVRRLVFVSSAAVYGVGEQRGRREDGPRVVDSFYAETKIAAEDAVLAYHRRGQIEGVIVRPTFVYGPGDRNFLPPILAISRLLVVPLVGGGKALVDLVDVRDLADAIIRAGTTSQAAGQAYNVTDGCRTTVRELIEIVAGAAGARPRFIQVPTSLAVAGVIVGRTLVGRLVPDARFLDPHAVQALALDHHFDIDKARAELGYRPVVAPEQGLREAVEWLQQNR